MKYREFLLVSNDSDCYDYDCYDLEDLESVELFKSQFQLTTHVIEYQALLDEAEAHKNTAAVSQTEIEKLQKQNEKLKVALEFYAMTSKTFPEYGELARDILKEIKDEK